MLLILLLIKIFKETLTKTNSEYQAAVKSLPVKVGMGLNHPTRGGMILDSKYIMALNGASTINIRQREAMKRKGIP